MHFQLILRSSKILLASQFSQSSEKLVMLLNMQ